jgi:hypothetical protein
MLIEHLGIFRGANKVQNAVNEQVYDPTCQDSFHK